MWSRPAFRGSASRSPSSRVRRLSTIGGVLLALTAATAGPASAAPSDITVALSPVAPRISTVVKQTPGSSTRGDVTVAYGGAPTPPVPPPGAPGPAPRVWLPFFHAHFPPPRPPPPPPWEHPQGPPPASRRPRAPCPASSGTPGRAPPTLPAARSPSPTSAATPTASRSHRWAWWTG